MDIVIKKIIILLFIILINFSILDFSYWNNCSYNWVWDVAEAIWDCLGNSSLVEAWNSWNLDVDDWFKEQLINWTKKIATYLAFWAIFSIAFGSLQMVLSWWEEEKIKKWKDVIKWWIIWFLWVVSAGFLISVVVKLIYTIWAV
jgi:hypothetical protein